MASFIDDASLSYRTNEGRKQTSNRPIGHLSVMKDAKIIKHKINILTL